MFWKLGAGGIDVGLETGVECPSGADPLVSVDVDDLTSSGVGIIVSIMTIEALFVAGVVVTVQSLRLVSATSGRGEGGSYSSAKTSFADLTVFVPNGKIPASLNPFIAFSTVADISHTFSWKLLQSPTW